MSEKNTLYDDEFIMGEEESEDFELNEQEEKVVSDKSDRIEFMVQQSEGAVAGFYDWIRCLIFAIAVVVICLTFVFRLVDVEGPSMDNTLASKDKVIVTNFAYTPKDNDIVVISHGAEYSKPIIKRIIATEGQSVKLDYENDRIIVDGVVIDEPYIQGTTFSGKYGDNEIPEVIPEGKVFVLGDNRSVSLDSRYTEIGLIDVDSIIGKAQFVVFPFSEFGYLY